MNERSYSDLSTLKTFEERYEYLRLDGRVGADTFGFDRWLNQKLYQSKEWRHVRDLVILRDNGCDLGVSGYEIYDKRDIRIHHMNPLTKEDIKFATDNLFNPDYLITTTHRTHNAIHYGNEQQLSIIPQERSRNDTCPWRR